MGSAIDVHHHAIPSRYRAALQAAFGASARTPTWTPQLTLEMMDRCEIAAAVLSLSAPGTGFATAEQAAVLARALNDEMADIAVRFPRLGALATLPLPHQEAACEEAVRALDVLKLDGVCLLTGYGGRYLGAPEFDPLFELLNHRSAVVLVHPAVHPSVAHVSLGVPNFLLEYPFDTTRAAVNMIFADVLDRFSDIRFILSHGGGTLPFLAWRIAEITMRQLSQPPAHERYLRDRHPTALTSRHEVVTADMVKRLMRRFWYDVALTADAPGLGALVRFADPKRILFGSDWPYAYEDTIADQQRSLADDSIVPPLERSQITQANAAALFPRLATQS